MKLRYALITAALFPVTVLAQIHIEPGQRIEVVCQQPVTEPGSPFVDPDPVDCGVIDPPVGASQKLIGGQTTVLYVTADTSSVLKFFSEDGSDVESITIDWDADVPVAVSTSQCPSDYDTRRPRPCFSGSASGSMMLSNVEAGNDECQLEPWREYFVSFAARNIITGRSTCDAYACEVAVTVTLNRP